MSTKRKDAITRVQKTIGPQVSLDQQTTNVEAAEVDDKASLEHGNLPKQKNESDIGKDQGQSTRINPQVIHPSPFQHRTVFDPIEMEELRKDISRHGIHNALIVRNHPVITGEYELVTGERRLRTALELELSDIPVLVRELTDRQAKELQWSENFRRVNPNPLDEATNLSQLLEYHKTVDGLARYIGKPKAYVLTRLRLLDLIPAIREMVHASIFNFKEAIELANLAPTAQSSFIKEYCTGWQEKKGFRLPNLLRALEQFRCDLNRAIFDPKDKSLVPEAGACTRCSFNSSTFQSLFPESEKRAICNRLECFENKCLAHLRLKLVEAIRVHQPDSIIFNGPVTKTWQLLLDEIPEAAGWPQFSYHDITTTWAPTEPDKEDFTDEDDNSFDDEGYAEALEEFQVDFAQYQQSMSVGMTRKGLWLQSGSIRFMLFNPEHRANGASTSQVAVTAAAVKQAIKAGTATPELLQAEMERIRRREKRMAELDREKVQKIVHDRLATQLQGEVDTPAATAQDQVAMRMLIYQSLDYMGRDALHDRLPYEEQREDGSRYLLTDWLSQLTEPQVAFMARLAIHHKSEATNPTSDTGQVLVMISEGIGIDVAGIRADQQKLADNRASKANDRLNSLERRITEIKPKIENPNTTG